jgi:queuine tRNA-ribosyltransferase subunit QTRTD1
MSSTGTALPVYTSVGFAMLEHEDYRDYALKLNPDIAIGLADMPYGDKPGVRRIQKMALRTEKWMKDFAQNSSTKSNTITTPSIFAPILLIEKGAQADYLELLETDLRDNIHGLAVYDTDSLAIIPKALSHLPRLALSDASKPQDVLRAIQLGADILAIPFINAATDAGIALCFTFPAPDKTTSADDARLPMGLDMWTTSHATDLSPLTADCTCYSCTKHHRAYIQHLLSAKEMLAWVLLQIHNLHIMDAFFQGIRRSITNVTFDDDVKAFNTAYEAELPEKTGQGPR